MDNHLAEKERLLLAERVRTACLEAALRGYEQAGLSGLCHEGAWEAAIDAMRHLNLKNLLQRSFSD